MQSSRPALKITHGNDGCTLTWMKVDQHNGITLLLASSSFIISIWKSGPTPLGSILSAGVTAFAMASKTIAHALLQSVMTLCLAERNVWLNLPARHETIANRKGIHRVRENCNGIWVTAPSLSLSMNKIFKQGPKVDIHCHALHPSGYSPER